MSTQMLKQLSVVSALIEDNKNNIKQMWYIVHEEIQLCVTAKHDQDPDPHWFGSFDPDSGPH